MRLCGLLIENNFLIATVCSDHFATEDYKRNLRAELLGEGKSRKLLHPDVVPHRNLPPDVEKNEDFKDLEKKYQLSDEEKIAVWLNSYISKIDNGQKLMFYRI